MDDWHLQQVEEAYQECWGPMSPYEVSRMRDVSGDIAGEIPHAIRYLRYEEGKRFRLGIKKVLETAGSLLRDKRGQHRGSKECLWCHGRKFIRVLVYFLDPWELDRYKPEDIRETRTGKFVLHSRVSVGRKSTELQLACDHCIRNKDKDILTVGEFHKRYAGFCTCEWELDQALYANILSDNPSPPEAAVPMPRSCQDALERLKNRHRQNWIRYQVRE